MGFALTGVAGSLGGVTVTANISGLTIRNGTVRGWGHAGIGASNAKGCILENLQAASNAINGILAGEDATVRDCTARLNTGIGISAQSGSTIVRSTAGGNTTTGIAGSGFAVTISHCSANSNGGIGIRANWNCAVSDCVSRRKRQPRYRAWQLLRARKARPPTRTLAPRKALSPAPIALLPNASQPPTRGAASRRAIATRLATVQASGNTGGSGIFAGIGSSLTNCTARGNTRW